MKIFLTGASGFLGSHTAHELIRRGNDVSALMRKTSSREGLPSALRFIEGALPDCRNLKEALEAADVVVHVAGVVKTLKKETFYEVNALGTENLVREILSLKNPPKLFLHISTIAVHHSDREEDFCLSPESCRPLTHYGKSKLEGEKALSPLKGKIKTIVLRPPVLYGPRDQELLPMFKAVKWGIVPVFGRGENELSVCYVEDVARAIADLTERPPAEDDIFCLDDGSVQTWKSMLQTLSEVVGRKAVSLPIPPFLFRPGAWFSQTFATLTGKPTIFTVDKVNEMEQPRWVCGHRKLSECTNWKPSVSFREGARKTFDFYRKEKVL
ncbi:MAG: NAD(P)-dependent oxidoreductase [bacterium]